MSSWFVLCVLGFLASIPLNFFSVEHGKLEKRYGKAKGMKIAETLGYLSGWGLFGSWIGIWISPQTRFIVPFFLEQVFWVPILEITITLGQVIVSSPLIILATWLGIRGVQDLTLKVAETHRPEKIVSTGIYAKIRHPQYLGGLIAHVGITTLLVAWWSLIITPLVCLGIWLISWKEEIELKKEFGAGYEHYQHQTSMFFPWRRKRSQAPKSRVT